LRDVPTDRPRLLVLNQYYYPGVEATAKLLTTLCEALADDYDVTVITGRLRDQGNLPDRDRRNGVEIIRVHSTTYDRAPLKSRATNYVTYLTHALRESVGQRRPDIVLCMTDPPLVGDVALVTAKRFRVPLVVISQDVFPEIAVALHRLTNPVLVRLLSVLTSAYLRRADRVVAIGETMADHLVKKGTDPKRLRVIPNWTDVESVKPAPRRNGWAAENGLDDRFVVMHSGNIGHAQNLDTLIRATTLLRDFDQLSVVLVGLGARLADYEALRDRLEVEAVRFLPYQPPETVSQSLSSADVHYVGLGAGLAGYVVPSRLYGIMAVGRPVLVSADDQSETAQLVQAVGCGIVVSPTDPVEVAKAIREFAAGAYDLDAMGQRGREYVESEAGRDQAIARYRALFDEVGARA
jgi:colanic acid biosynthesis glycosyl transferase WcaI